MVVEGEIVDSLAETFIEAIERSVKLFMETKPFKPSKVFVNQDVLVYVANTGDLFSYEQFRQAQVSEYDRLIRIFNSRYGLTLELVRTNSAKTSLFIIE